MKTHSALFDHVKSTMVRERVRQMMRALGDELSVRPTERDGLAMLIILFRRSPDRAAKILSSLTYREREIIKLRYGIGDGYTYTLEEVGKIFKVTRERIRMVEAKAIRKLNHPVRLNALLSSIQEHEEALP